MRPEWLVLIPLAVGHLAAFVVLTNVVHALGWTDRLMSRIKLALLVSSAALSTGLFVLVVFFEWKRWPLPMAVYAAICLFLAFGGLPLVTLQRAFRREPEGIEERSVTSDFAECDGRDPLIGDGAYSWLLRINANESFQLCKREWIVRLPGLPPRWDGLSVVQITDLHFAPCYRQRYFERVADEVLAWDADLVLFTGDLVDHDDAIAWIVPVMSRLRGRLGTFSILGNHDYDHDAAAIAARLEDAGFVSLEGRWHELDVDGHTLALGGTSYPWGPRLDLQQKGSADFRLLLSHTPDLFYQASAAGIDLMLSGHNHGGQIRVPVVGPVFMPSVYSRRFDRGYFRSGRTTMYVSQGVGGKHPIRIGCTPEISRFVLRSTLAPHLVQSAPRHDEIDGTRTAPTGV